MRDVAGLVLTGGASQRFGIDKATLLVGGERLADRTARVLGMVAAPVLEVGPGFATTDPVREEPPGGGPLVAVAAGGAALRSAASTSAVLVLAVDLPRVDVAALTWLAEHPASKSVVPVVAGSPQSMFARYSTDALQRAGELVTAGERSVRALLDAIGVHYADEREWGASIDARVFSDVDTRDDAAALGVEIPGGR